MNKIRFEYPLVIYIYSPSEQELDLNINFKEKGYLIDVEIYSDKLASKSESGEWLWVTKGIRFIVEEVRKKKGTLSNFVENPNKYPELLSLLTSFINVVLKNIRNFGITPHVNEIYPREDEAERYLRLWKSEIFTQDGNWQEIFPESKEWRDITRLFFAPHIIQPTPTLEASNWADIKLAIQEKREPPPEREFMVNAIEFMNLNNWRLALLESIICLEIVLSQYLNEYIKIYKDDIQKSAKEILNSPMIGLTSRILVLLPITLHTKDLEKIKFEDVRKAINLRNDIVHGTGNLPKNYDLEDVKNKIWNVLTLAETLSLRREQIKASPEMNKIAEKISKEYNIPKPKIWVLKNHHILMEFVFFSIDCFPKVSILKELIKSISDHLLNRDRLFDANKHLYINFIKFPREIVERWHQGKYELIQKKLSKN